MHVCVMCAYTYNVCMYVYGRKLAGGSCAGRPDWQEDWNKETQL
jgi:hypothetical protein